MPSTPALDVLIKERPQLTTALTKLGNFSDTATQLANDAGDDLVADLKNLGPLLGKLADIGPDLNLALLWATAFPYGPQFADTITKGVYSMLVATLAVVIFMIIYYRFAGVVANIALLLNILLIVAFMIMFNAAFTLSGLAGLALTVGMAVDANVLIYERMREELSRGATLRMAIRNGFGRATTTIIDAKFPCDPAKVKFGKNVKNPSLAKAGALTPKEINEYPLIPGIKETKAMSPHDAKSKKGDCDCSKK